MVQLISIVLPVYNGEQFIKQAIESVLRQTYKSFELIIVNDCSTDKTLEIITEFSEKDERIKIINNQTNKKLPASLNLGHEKAKGNFVTWTSDDNILLPNFLDSFIKVINNKQADVVYSNYEVVDEAENLKRIHKAGQIEHILFGNKIGASFLYKKQVYDSLKGYNESLFLLEDYDFWLRASMKYKFHYLDEILYKYRVHGESLTSNIILDPLIKEKHEKGVLKMFNEISSNLSWQKNTLEFIVHNFLNKPISIVNYLDKSKTITNDLFNFSLPFLNKKKMQNGLRSLLREHLTTNKNNRNIKTLIKVLKKDKTLLFHSDFSKKTTLIYTLKSIINL